MLSPPCTGATRQVPMHFELGESSWAFYTRHKFIHVHQCIFTLSDVEQVYCYSRYVVYMYKSKLWILRALKQASMSGLFVVQADDIYIYIYIYDVAIRSYHMLSKDIYIYIYIYTYTYTYIHTYMYMYVHVYKWYREMYYRGHSTFEPFWVRVVRVRAANKQFPSYYICLCIALYVMCIIYIYREREKDGLCYSDFVLFLCIYCKCKFPYVQESQIA